MFNLIKIQTYKIFSNFLSYPDYLLKQNIHFTMTILKDEKILNIENLNKIKEFIYYIKNNDLLFLQENYVAIFDRQKQFSLYLFEHIYGDSRERGMAMIDLKNLYRKSNFDLPINVELPDFIPVFLEYLSINTPEKAVFLLDEIVNIISVLHQRLKKINNLYYIIFYILESLSNIKSDINIINEVVNINNSLNSINF